MNQIAKVIFAGPTNVEKSSIIYRFDHEKLTNNGPTIGAVFNRKTVTKDGGTIVLDIWDTAGQERYYSMSAHYFRNATYCILVFDITDSDSFEKKNKHLEKIMRRCQCSRG
ncbi:Ras family GTPase [uncultured virus]|nr:Ras family GTPase [uncultured virus]